MCWNSAAAAAAAARRMSAFEPDFKSHVLQQITPQRPADQSAYLEPPPGFPKTVGKAQSNSPDDVLASNFGRKLHVDEAASGE